MRGPHPFRMGFCLADNSTKIAALENALYSGVLSVVVDGVQTRFQSAADLRRSIEDLKKTDTTDAYPTKRRLTRIALNGGGPL